MNRLCYFASGVAVFTSALHAEGGSYLEGRKREDPGNEVAGDRGWSPRR